MATTFTINTYPEIGSTRFQQCPDDLGSRLRIGHGGGLSDPDMAADLIFYKNHPERMNLVGNGLPLRSTERGYSTLVEEWEGWRDVVDARFEKPAAMAWSGHLPRQVLRPTQTSRPSRSCSVATPKAWSKASFSRKTSTR